KVVMTEVIAREHELPEAEESVELDTIPQLFSRFCQENRFSEGVVRLFEFYYRGGREGEETE
ncbi:MAG: hypothetical protein ABDK92_07615, partial [Atribacterota bacterium]